MSIVGRHTADILGIDIMKKEGFIETTKEILSTPDERHAFIVGIGHSFYRSRKPPTKYMEEVISPEYHYYVVGRGVGHIVKVAVIAAIVVIAWRHRK